MLLVVVVVMVVEEVVVRGVKLQSCSLTAVILHSEEQ